MKIAVVSGSFDPITAGHMDLVRVAAGIFDAVHVVIVANGEKSHGLFSPADRMQIAERAVQPYKNVHLGAIMRRFDPELETVFLPAPPERACISSTYVRELLKYGCPLDGAVPDGCASLVRALYDAR